MNSKQLRALGIPGGPSLDEAQRLLNDARKATAASPDNPSIADTPQAVAEMIRRVVADPAAFEADPKYGRFAKGLIVEETVVRDEPVAWRQWGIGLEAESVAQMRQACRLPVAVRGALMPDAHVGYGLPIGGVLATENAVVPYAVGVDIACRMKMTVLDIPIAKFSKKMDRLRESIETETRFGVGASFKVRREHDVMDLDWSVSPITRQNKDRAWSQLGTSGSGNHFVEFGVFVARERIGSLEPGEYVALLSHSGSRGTGAAVCQHYSRVATNLRPGLPQGMRQLAWLDMDSEAGQEYWAAMNLMGAYAAANHACIHAAIRNHLGVEVLLDVENHHNFAWKETHVIDGVARELYVHRKGATPAGSGVLGIIPGSMATPGFLVRGLGNPESLNSASHGAGRVMSRTRANQKFSWKAVNQHLRDCGVELISAGLDEAPMVYKDIHAVMAAQTDLVEKLGEFQPRLVKMAPAGERPED